MEEGEAKEWEGLILFVFLQSLNVLESDFAWQKRDKPQNWIAERGGKDGEDSCNIEYDAFQL